MNILLTHLIRTLCSFLLFVGFLFAADEPGKNPQRACPVVEELAERWVRNREGKNFKRTGRAWADLRSEWFRNIGGFDPKFLDRHEPRYPEIAKALELDHLWGLKVLDAGTGDGTFVEDLRAAGVDAVGLDIVLTEAQKAKDYFVQADMRETGLPTGSFDVIVSSYATFHYFSHKNPYADALKELARLLKPGGRLVLLNAPYGHDAIWSAKKLDVMYPKNKEQRSVYFLLKKRK